LSCGASIDDTNNFQVYIRRQYEDYLDGKLVLTHNILLKMAKMKYNWLVGKKKLGAKSSNDEKIVAMAAKIKLLKGQHNMNPKLSEIVDKKDEKKKVGKKMHKKKDTSNKQEQKKDEAWKTIPPKYGNPKEKRHGEYTYHWCEHHMAWTVH
jgi:hypothetical protein